MFLPCSTSLVILLHGLLPTKNTLPFLEPMFLEIFSRIPSQINEFFLLEPSVLKNYALHYETKQPMPQTLVDKIKKAYTFNKVMPLQNWFLQQH